jgi:glycosyltransferase involved in cell wall biosynthesis
MSASSPTVSAIIPTHNRSQLLERAVQSALQQASDVSLEVIVVDDHSDDNTSDILSAFGSEIRAVRTETNIERGAARNLGARCARGDILAFLDSDDEWLPGKLAAQLQAARRGVPSVTGVQCVNEAGRPIRSPFRPPADAWSNIRFENRMLGAGSSLVVARRVFETLDGFPEAWLMQGSEDWAFMVKLWAAGYVMRVIPEPLVAVRVHAGNSTGPVETVVGCQWAAVDHLVRRGYIEGEDVRRLRGRTAGGIARLFAHAGLWEDAAIWSLVAARDSTLLEAATGLTKVALSGGRGVLRRRGI